MSITKNKYQSLTEESKTEIIDVLKKDSTKIDTSIKDKKIDSIKNSLDEKMKNSFIPIPEETRKQVLAEVEKEAKDSTNSSFNDKDFNLQFGGSSRLDKFINYQKKYPDSKIDVALDSLSYDKNFTNRFLYTRAKAANSFTKSEESRQQFFNQTLSSGSISLFVLLPIFSLFLKLFYIRKKYTYIDHLIFVFHTQTVFFMLFSIFYLFKIFGVNPEIWIFLVLFLAYLFIAMKNFYMQGYTKTALKFILLNICYSIVASIGVGFVFLIAFALF